MEKIDILTPLCHFDALFKQEIEHISSKMILISSKPYWIPVSFDGKHLHQLSPQKISKSLQKLHENVKHYQSFRVNSELSSNRSYRKLINFENEEDQN